MEEKLITIKEVSLNNNCPECYSTEGLKLTFRQKFKENAFYKSITNDIVQALSCTNCDSKIYPVSWTNDIERVVAYQVKAFEPKKASLKLKRLTWIIIVCIDLIILGIVIAIFFPELIGLQ